MRGMTFYPFQLRNDSRITAIDRDKETLPPPKLVLRHLGCIRHRAVARGWIKAAVPEQKESFQELLARLLTFCHHDVRESRRPIVDRERPRKQ